MSAPSRPRPLREPMPRGIRTSGPALLSYGFRPFFLLAGGFAVLAMALWMLALGADLPLAGEYGALNWHAHEMLFGYGAAALAGFMLTAVPNWTGRLPVSGGPLASLVGVWLLGRFALLGVPWIGLMPAIVLDSVFLPLLAAIAGREIIAGKNWQNLKVLVAVGGLALINLAFHVNVLLNGQALLPERAGVAAFVLLVALIGGRIVPSFTRNFLSRRGRTALPAPFGRTDRLSVVTLALALAGWIVAPDSSATGSVALIAAGVNLYRLLRWRGWAAASEKLVLVMHVGMLFVPLGLGAIAAASFGLIAGASALHVLTVGVIGVMTLAVMTRASRGHTGNPLHATLMTQVSYLALILAALLRPLAELFPQNYYPLLIGAGILWLAAYLLFLAEYGPMLLRHRRSQAT